MQGCCHAWPTLQELNGATQQRWGHTPDADEVLIVQGQGPGPGQWQGQGEMQGQQQWQGQGQACPQGQVLLKGYSMTYLNGSFSISISLKVKGAPALGAPVSPHHNVRLQYSPNGLGNILQILPLTVPC